jgi:hypothetical protein
MDNRPWTQYERLAGEEAALKRRFMKAIFDDDTAEVRRTRAEMESIEARRERVKARIRSGFDVVA